MSHNERLASRVANISAAMWADASPRTSRVANEDPGGSTIALQATHERATRGEIDAELVREISAGAGNPDPRFEPRQTSSLTRTLT